MLSQNPRVVDDPVFAGERHARPRFDTSIYESLADVEAAGIRIPWQDLAVASSSRQALFQSPAWWDHVRFTAGEGIVGTFAAQDAEGNVVGVAPFCGQEVFLDFSIKTRSFGKVRLKAVELLGGEPMLPPDMRLYDQLFAAIDAGYRQCDCIKLEMVPTDGFCWRYLNESSFIRDRFLLYVPDGIVPTRVVRLPGSFESYLAKFKSKNRSNLRKKVRLLREHGGGTLRLDRYESPDEVAAFLEAGAPVAIRSWQHAAVGERIANNDPWTHKLTDLAQRGLFRGYVLVCGQTPCEFVLGYQYDGVYHYVQPGYDPSFADMAPGIVALYLLIEDLIVHRPAPLLSFGYSDSDYKQMFGNASSLDASVVLLRKTPRNRLRRASHRAFRSTVRRAKSFVRWKRA